MSVTGTRGPADGLDHRPSYLNCVAKPDLSSAAGRAWLVTFTDLMGLLLAFFVLLFSMSQIEQSKWEGLVDGLAVDLNTLRKEENVKPALDLHPKEEAVVPGAVLDYLTPIIREQIAAHPMLAQAAIRHTADRLVISLPADLLFGAGAAVALPQAAELGSALVSVLRNLNNSIEVEAQLERADWGLALARAAAFSRILNETGYTGRIVARATAATGAPKSQGARLDIVIHASERKPR